MHTRLTCMGRLLWNPPALQGFWQAFMEDAGQLSLQHPFTAKPTTKDYCNWAACFGLGAVVGLFCINPDAGGSRVCRSGRCTKGWLRCSSLCICRAASALRCVLAPACGEPGHGSVAEICPGMRCATCNLPPLFATNAGNYGVWESQCRQFCDRWAPGFAQAGCALTLQRHRDYFLQASVVYCLSCRRTWCIA